MTSQNVKQIYQNTQLDKSIKKIRDFIIAENNSEQSKNYQNMRVVGRVLSLGYQTARVITQDAYKNIVGGVSRNSFLIMLPELQEDDKGQKNYASIDHFILLRVRDAAAIPLESEVQQTYFELQKSSMPEIDIFTQSELQWSALNTDVQGMFYLDKNSLKFAGDVNNYLSPHKYIVFSPNDEILSIIVNEMVSKTNPFKLGKLRLT